MRRIRGYVIFGVVHLVVSIFTFLVAVVGAEGLYLSGRFAHPPALAQFWEIISAVLAFPIPLAILLLIPAFPWKTLWAYLPFVANSAGWAVALWYLVPLVRSRLARA